MNPFFFGSSSQPLFGAYHPPSDGRGKNRGVVICNPFGDEMIKSHRAIRQLAGELAGARLHTLRFDYFGTGDSSGDDEEGDVERWRNDVGQAADELKDTSGAAKVALTGLRFGATLAFLAGAGRRDCYRVALWDPVVNGQAYLDELRAHHDAYLASEFHASGPALEDAGFGPDEIMGFPFDAALRERIATIDLTEEDPGRLREVRIVATTKAADYEQLRAALERRGVDVTLRHVPVGFNWNADEALNSSLVPTEAISAVVEALRP
jgi:uncharacterized protein